MSCPVDSAASDALAEIVGSLRPYRPFRTGLRLITRFGAEVTAVTGGSPLKAQGDPPLPGKRQTRRYWRHGVLSISPVRLSHLISTPPQLPMPVASPLPGQISAGAVAIVSGNDPPHILNLIGRWTLVR